MHPEITPREPLWPLLPLLLFGIHPTSADPRNVLFLLHPWTQMTAANKSRAYTRHTRHRWYYTAPNQRFQNTTLPLPLLHPPLSPFLHLCVRSCPALHLRPPHLQHFFDPATILHDAYNVLPLHPQRPLHPIPCPVEPVPALEVCVL